MSGLVSGILSGTPISSAIQNPDEINYQKLQQLSNQMNLSGANTGVGRLIGQANDTDASYAGGGGGSAGSYSSADEQAQYQDQIDQINRLLGNIGVTRDQGSQRLNQSAADAMARLNEQKTKAMEGYDQQSLQNSQQRQRGVESVDQFANTSYKNLQRVLQGAHAGGGSVARQLVPQLVSQSAGTRRQGVFNTAGENEQAITSARGDATDQFKYSEQDLQNQKKQQEEDFLRGLLNQESDLLGKRASAESARAAATGAGYQAARAAAAGTRSEIDSRTAQLNALFGQYAPTFNARAVNLKTPELGKFTVDPAQLRSDQSLPTDSRVYMSALKKKQQGVI